MVPVTHFSWITSHLCNVSIKIDNDWNCEVLKQTYPIKAPSVPKLGPFTLGKEVEYDETTLL